MLFREVARTALRSLASNRLRSALTALGVIIGVAAVICVLSIGEGATASVEGRVRSMGTNLMYVRPRRGSTTGVRSGPIETLTRADAQAIREIPGVRRVAAEVSGTAEVQYLHNHLSATIHGASPEYLEIRALDVATGLGFAEYDDAQRQRVAVIGATVARDLFPGESALGQRIQIRGLAFRVIGILAPKGDAGFFTPDDMVFVPLGTHQGVLFGQPYLTGVNVQIESESEAARVQRQIEDLLRLRHRLRDDQESDFEVRSQTELLAQLGQITATLTALLGSVAAVSLLVGGIGIMNIMLVSVRERTREIGVRMAVGARRRDILLQFLVEAVVVSLLGGFFGIVLGAALSLLFATLGNWTLVIPAYGIVLSLAVSMVIGVVFGVGPARRAARLDPVEALRHD